MNGEITKCIRCTILNVKDEQTTIITTDKQNIACKTKQKIWRNSNKQKKCKRKLKIIKKRKEKKPVKVSINWTLLRYSSWGTFQQLNHSHVCAWLFIRLACESYIHNSGMYARTHARTPPLRPWKCQSAEKPNYNSAISFLLPVAYRA